MKTARLLLFLLLSMDTAFARSSSGHSAFHAASSKPLHVRSYTRKDGPLTVPRVMPVRPVSTIFISEARIGMIEFCDEMDILADRRPPRQMGGM
jgi:hypothetical protein